MLKMATTYTNSRNLPKVSIMQLGEHTEHSIEIREAVPGVLLVTFSKTLNKFLLIYQTVETVILTRCILASRGGVSTLCLSQEKFHTNHSILEPNA